MVDAQKLTELIGTAEASAAFRRLNELERASPRASPGKSDETKVHELVQAIAGVAPRDAIEGMLAVQMLALHSAAMASLGNMSATQDTRLADLHLRRAGKLLRLYGAALESLRRHRGGGQQVVRIERVDVSSGGQAIIGAVSRGGGTKNLRALPEGPAAGQKRGLLGPPHPAGSAPP